MAFSPDELAAITAILDSWCEDRVPIMVRDQVVLQYRVTRHDVLLFEKRRMLRGPAEWIELPVAKFRFNRRRGYWTLLWRDLRFAWHTYRRLEPTPRFEDLVREVDEDPTGIFWG